MRRSRPSKRPAASLRPRQGPGPKLLTLTPALVAVVTFLAFLPTLQNGFVTWDDDRNFLAHSIVTRKPDGSLRIDYEPVVITRWPPGERVYGQQQPELAKAKA